MEYDLADSDIRMLGDVALLMLENDTFAKNSTAAICPKDHEYISVVRKRAEEKLSLGIRREPQIRTEYIISK